MPQADVSEFEIAHFFSLRVAAITTNNRGYVIVTFGANSGGPGGNVEFGPDGTVVGDGGGAWFLVPTT